MNTVLTYIRQALTALASVPKTPHAAAIGAQLKACASNAEAHIATELATEAAKVAAAVIPPTVADLQAANEALQAKLGALTGAPPSGGSSAGAPTSGATKTKATTKSVLGALGVLFVSFVLFVGTASAQPTPFNQTNVLSGSGFGVASIVVAGFPTNVATTVLGQGTGGPVGLMNNDNACLVFKCYVCTNVAGGSPTTNNVVITLIRSAAANSPQVVTGTNLFTGNGTNLQSTDWETWSNVAPALGQIIVPINLTTGLLTWSTNLSREFIGANQWLGIGSISANFTNGFLTNVSIAVAKKIIPIRYP